MLKNTNQKSNRHCEQSEAISSRLPRATALAMTNETGRSMVEMLGVLAVIGVLSITGISGYTTAMNKHRANEILDAASKRAVVVSTQLQSGRTNPTLAEFGTDNTVGGATFSTELETQGTDKFVIKFTSDGKPSAEIWTQMQNIAGTSGIVRSYESGQTGLVYNNDLTTEARTSDYNNNESGCTSNSKKYCAGSKLCVETSVNCNTTCSGTISACQKCDATGAIVADTGKSCTTEDEETGTCNASAECEALANPCTGSTPYLSIDGTTCLQNCANTSGYDENKICHLCGTFTAAYQCLSYTDCNAYFDIDGSTFLGCRGYTGDKNNCRELSSRYSDYMAQRITYEYNQKTYSSNVYKCVED